MDGIIRLPEVIRITGLGKTSIYQSIKADGFPAPLKLTERARGWKASEISAWLESRERAMAA